MLSFPDSTLGPHVERAYQALAIEETRTDFVCNKWTQTDAGKRKKQVLQQVRFSLFDGRAIILLFSQCWFTGSHADVSVLLC